MQELLRKRLKDVLNDIQHDNFMRGMRNLKSIRIQYPDNPEVSEISEQILQILEQRINIRNTPEDAQSLFENLKNWGARNPNTHAA